MNLFDLVAVLTLNKSAYEAGLNDASNEADTFGSKLKNGLGTAAKVGTAAIAAVGTAAVGVTKSVISASGEVAELGDHIDKQSQKIGISAKAYQEWDFILQHNGASVDSLQTSMKTMATQAQKNADEFKLLGISEEELGKLGTEDLFARVVQGLQGMEEGTERTAIASKLLGRSATELGSLLNSTAEETEAMRQQAHDLGKVLSDEAVKSGAAYQDSLYNMQTAISGVKNKMMSDFLPGLVSVMDGLTGIFAGDSSAMSKIEDGIAEFTNKLTEIIPKIAEIVANFIETFGKAVVKNLPSIGKAAVKIINSLVQTIADNLDMVVDVVIDIIDAFIDAFIDNLPKIIDGIITLVTKIIEKLPKIISKLIKAIPKVIKMLVKGLMDNLPEIISGIISLVLEIVNNLPTIISELVRSIPEIIGMIINGFVSNMPQLIAGAIQIVVGLVSHLPEIIAGLIQAIPQIISNILSAFGPLGEGLASLFGGFLGGISDVLGGEGGLVDIIGGVLGEAYNVASGIFEWFGHLMDDPAAALEEAFDGIKNYAIKVFESVKTIITGIFDLIDAKRAESEAKALNAKVKAQEEQAILEGKAHIVAGNTYSQEFWDALEATRKVKGSSFGTSAYTEVTKRGTETLEHKGTITIKGVSNDGEFEQSKDIVVEQLINELGEEVRVW